MKSHAVPHGRNSLFKENPSINFSLSLNRICSLAVLVFAACSSPSPVSGANLLKDSSFEVPGNNHWGYEGSKFTESDFAADAVHGAYSLRWPHVNPLMDWPYDQPTTGLNQGSLYYQPVSAIPGRQYTISAWAKTDSNSSLMGTLRFLIHDGDRATKKLIASSPVMTLTRSWQRYSYTLTLPTASNSRYVVGIEFRHEAKDALPYPSTPRAHGLVDAVQFEEGALTTYQAPHAVEFGFLPQAPANAFVWGQDVVIDLYACNTSPTAITKTVTYTVEDFFDRVVRSNSLTLSLPSKVRIKQRLNLGSNLRGHFRILLKEDGIVRTEKVFSTIPQHKNVLAKDSIFGVDATYSDFMLSLVKRLGFNWLRPHKELSWEQQEPKQGQFRFSDFRVQLATSKGLSTYGFLYRTPEWARPKGGTFHSMPTNIAAWSNFVYRSVLRFKDFGIDHWEIFNEPAYVLTSAEYLSLFKAAHGAAKRANPNSKLFGWSSWMRTPDSYPYSDITDQLVPYMDLVSAHYYPGFSGVAKRAYYDSLLQHRQVVGQNRFSLWNTEGGGTGGGTFYRTKGDFEIDDERNPHTETTSKMWAIHKAANVRLFYYWMNYPNQDHTPGWSYSWTFNEYDSSLKASAVATAAAAYFLDGAGVTFRGFVYEGADKAVTAYGFKRDASDHIVVAWLDGTDRTVYLTNPSLPARVNVYDMFGRVLGAYNTGQKLEVALRSTPVYIEVLGYTGNVDANFLRIGSVVPDNSLVINTTLNPGRVQIFGSAQNPPTTAHLVYQATVTQQTPLVFPWNAPVTQPNADTLVLLHMDNRSEYGESTTTVRDFGSAGRNGTVISDSGQSLVYGDSYGRLAGGFRSAGGTYNRAIVVPNNGAFNGLGQFTASLWVKLDASSGANRLFSLGNVSAFSPGNPAFVARIRESSSHIIFRVSDGTNARERWSAIPFPKGDGIYHHLTFVFDGRSSDPNARRLDIYLDGKKVNGTLQSGTIPATTRTSSSDNLYIAGYASPGPAEALRGDLDEFVFEKRALNDTEISTRSGLVPGQNYYWFVRTIGSTTVNSPVQVQPAGANFLTYQIAASGQNCSISISPQQTTYAAGQQVTISAIPNSGYTFTGWSGSVNSTANPLVLTVNSDLSLVAAVQSGGSTPPPPPPSYRLTLNSINGTITASPSQSSYTSGQTVSLTASPEPGYTFTGWSGDASGSANPITITMNRDMSVTANFAQTSGGGGTGGGGTGGTTPGAVLINEVATGSGSPLRVDIYGSTSSNPGVDELLLRDVVPNGTAITYLWAAPVIKPDSRTLALFHFDQRTDLGESGTTVRDSSAYRRHGTLVPSGSTLEFGTDYGVFAGAYRGDGSTQNKTIRLPNNGHFDGLSQFTIAFWLSANPPNYSARLFSLGDVNSYSLSGAAFAARLRETGSQLIFQVSDGVVTQQRWSSVPFPRGDGKYHHVAFVYSGTANSGSTPRLEIYLDGKLVNGGVVGSAVPVRTKLNTQQDLYLLGHAGTGPSKLLNGTIDEFVMYDRALSAIEIAALQTLPVGKPVYWFQKSVGTTETVSPVRSTVVGSNTPSSKPGQSGATKLGDGTLQLHETATGNGSPLRVDLYGSTGSSPTTEELLFRQTVANGAPIEYVWVAPVLKPDSRTLALFHFDRRTELGETGITIRDSSGYRRHGTLQALSGNTLEFGEDYGVFAGAYRGDGSQQNKSIRVPNNGNFDGLTQFTIAFWLSADPPNYSTRLFSLGEANSYSLAGAPFAARLRETGSQIIFQVSDGVATQQRWSSVPFPRGDGKYHHVAFVYSGTASSGSTPRLEIYLDGELVNGGVVGSTVPARTKLNSQQDLYLLGYTSSGPSKLLNGSIDEFVMYDRALSAAEIAALQTLPAGKPVYWFQKSVGTTETVSPVRTFTP